MPSLLDNWPAPAERPITFAQPDERLSFGEKLSTLRQFSPPEVVVSIGLHPKATREMFGAAERQTMLVDTVVSQNIATEQAYDRRIKAIKEATGVELENPLRGGYGDQVKRAARDAVRDRLAREDDEPTAPAVTGGSIFEAKLAELRAAHPDKAEALTFGDIKEEAKAIAKGSDAEYEAAKKTTPLNAGAGLAVQFAGSAWGMRRDPLFVGSLFAGPTSAVGKTVAARIATSSLFQGLYNAGISALEQPAVQQWRSEIGVRSGVMPAIENVGLAFLFGVIPGAAFRGLHELGQADRAAVQRVLRGAPEGDDVEKVMQLARSMRPDADEPAAAAVRLGAEMDDAARITQPRPPKDMAPELHDDLTTAAQRYADDPLGQPSPEGVAATRAVETLPPEVSDRIAAAQPKTVHDAQMAASEALEDIGNRDTIARTRAQMENDRLPKPPPLPEGTPLPPARSKDPLDKLPMVRDDGTPTLVSPQQARRAGERETQFADLIRECK